MQASSHSSLNISNLVGQIVRFSSIMPIPRWRNVHLLRSSFSQPNPTATQIARCHSTPLCEKWRNKWSSVFLQDVNKGQEPSKNHIRYATRQKRADAKKALKNLLYNSGSSIKKSDFFLFFRIKHLWSKFMRESFFEDYDDQPETMFQVTFGKRWYTWSFASSNDSFHGSSSGFEWRDHSHWKSRRAEEWHSDSNCKTEFDGDSYVMGSSSDQSILGLPPRGPLKIEEVKKA